MSDIINSMISPNISQKLPKEFLTYQTTILVIFFVITIPLNILYFLPVIILLGIYIKYRFEYNNFSFSYDEKQIEIRKGIFTKSQKTIPFSIVQNINLVSGILLRQFGLRKVEIWTSSPSQIQIISVKNQGNETEHRPDGMLILKASDAELLQKFIIDHK
ncbi:MAG: PH domain-containing protein [Candidatus Paceibacterota bacterium]|jgi:membrane protein YdbS with pleckstrin-like domain